MKTKLFFMALIMAFGLSVYADDQPEANPGQDKEIPVIIHKRKLPTKYAPAKGIEIFMIYKQDEITFILPPQLYPAEVSICGDGTTSGSWTTTLVDASGLMPFDGDEGSYCLEISTPDGSYVGYFTLE